MVLFRRYLVWVQRRFVRNRKQFLLRWLGVCLGCVVVSLAGDMLLPTGTWAMTVRAALLLPTSWSMFTVGYALSLWMHDRMGWTALRLRMSPRWRVRSAVLVGAALAVCAYGTATHMVGYTALSSLWVAVALGAVAFARATSEEAKWAQVGLPDPRDVAFDSALDAHRAAGRRRHPPKPSSGKGAVYSDHDGGTDRMSPDKFGAVEGDEHHG